MANSGPLHHPSPSCLGSLTRIRSMHTHTPLPQWGPETSKEPERQTPSRWDPPTTLMLTPPATAAVPGAAENVLGPGSQASPALPASCPSSRDYEDCITNPISQVRKVRPAEADRQAPVLTAKVLGLKHHVESTCG